MGGKSSSEEPVLVIAEWTDAEWRDFPYMAGLSRWSNPAGFMCGASIISLDGYNGKGVALTAAHCVDDLDSTADELYAHVGCTLTRCGGQGVGYKAERWLMHPSYNPDWLMGHLTDDDDVALIFLESAIDFPGATAVQLYSDFSISKGDRIRQLGYGGTRGDDDCIGCSDLDTLEYHWTHFVPAWMCVFSKVATEGIGGADFCTEDWDRSDGKVTTCGGDSGSPLVYKNVQLGLVSRGVADCDPHQPSISTSVPHFYDWIDSECAGCLQYVSTFTSQLYGVQSGTQYSAQASSGGWIKSLKVWYDSSKINGLQLQYSDGAWSTRYGSASGTAKTYAGGSSCFSSAKVNADSRINGLQFTLSDGEKTPQYGGQSGQQYQESGRVWGYCLSGLTLRMASSSSGFNAMQFTFQQVEMNSVEQAFTLEQGAAAEEEMQHQRVVNIVAVCSAILGVCLLGAIVAFVWHRRRKKNVVQQAEMKTALLDGQNDEEQELEIEVDVALE